MHFCVSRHSVLLGFLHEVVKRVFAWGPFCCQVKKTTEPACLWIFWSFGWFGNLSFFWCVAGFFLLVGFWKWTRSTLQKTQRRIGVALCLCRLLTTVGGNGGKRGRQTLLFSFADFIVSEIRFAVLNSKTTDSRILFVFLFGYSKRDFNSSMTCCEESVSVKILKEKIMVL